MALSLGLVGLPNAGKSTLFNALTAGSSAVGNFPFTTADRHHGVAVVEDPRLQAVGCVHNSAKIVPAAVDVVDIAGLVRGASSGEGLGNRFLAHIRDVDLILHVVRCFDDPSVVEVDAAGDPVQALDVVLTELLLADLQTLENRMERISGAVKARDKEALREAETITALQAHLNEGSPASTHEAAANPIAVRPLTAKRVLIAANVSDANSKLERLVSYAQELGWPLVAINARVCLELLDLGPEDQSEMRRAFPYSDIKAVVDAATDALDLITFFTGNKRETRAWMVPRNTAAVDAAGKIHSDMQRGFIACEAINWRELVDAGSWANAKDKGRIRTEGASYSIAEGDVVLFRFNA